MKKITLLTVILFSVISYAQVGINTDTPDASSALEVESTTGGILIPRMTEAQRDAIGSPATGLMIYQTDQDFGFYFYNGTQWTSVGMSGPQGPQGETGATGPAGPQGEQGIQGIQGVAGADGTNGSDGSDGSDGSSAYEIWVTAGNTGTESDFLASLVGAQGEQGIQGPQGETGATGPLISGDIGQTLYNNGSEWVSSSNFYNNGDIIAIGSNNIDESAVLQIESTDKGVLFPRMTNAQRLAIVNPAIGLMVYVTDLNGGRFMFYNGVKWGTISFSETTPSSPTVGFVSCGDGQASVPFTAPSNNGGLEITHYTATSNPGGVTGTLNQADSGTIIVTGLTNNVAYIFTVTASNDIGTGAESTSSNTVTPGPTIGNYYQGGIVFYILQDGDLGYVPGETHGLIAAVEDQSSAIQWYNGSNSNTGATSAAIGMGETNTNSIISVQGTTESDYAAGLARSYNGGGYNDWFLPSRLELLQMYNNRALIDERAALYGGSSFYTGGGGWYWSSTEEDDSNAWFIAWSSGVVNKTSKISTRYVRAVRAF